MPSSACDWSSDVCSSDRSEEHTSELQSRSDLVCRLLLEKKKNKLLQSGLAAVSVTCVGSSLPLPVSCALQSSHSTPSIYDHHGLTSQCPDAPLLTGALQD